MSRKLNGEFVYQSGDLHRFCEQKPDSIKDKNGEEK